LDTRFSSEKGSILTGFYQSPSTGAKIEATDELGIPETKEEILYFPTLMSKFEKWAWVWDHDVG